MIGVAGETRRLREPIDSVPLAARRVEGIDGSLVIVEGSPGWPQRSLAAVHAGAAALLITSPVADDDEEIAALEVVSARMPVVLDRPWLRADVVADAAPPEAARHVAVDAAASASELEGVVRDAIGWLRVFFGGEVSLRAAAALPHGLLALFEEQVSGRSAALTASALIGRGGARLRAHAIGETRVEVEIDAATGARSVEVATSDGSMRRSRRHEAPERLALRRAVDAMVAGVCPDDLRGFRRDSAYAAEVLAADKQG